MPGDISRRKRVLSVLSSGTLQKPYALRFQSIISGSFANERPDFVRGRGGKRLSISSLPVMSFVSRGGSSNPACSRLTFPGKTGQVSFAWSQTVTTRSNGTSSRLSDVRRPMVRNIDARLSHDRHCIRIQSVRFDPRGVRFERIAVQSAGESLRHLASAGIPRTEKEYSFLRLSHTRLFRLCEHVL